MEQQCAIKFVVMPLPTAERDIPRRAMNRNSLIGRKEVLLDVQVLALQETKLSKHPTSHKGRRRPWEATAAKSQWPGEGRRQNTAAPMQGSRSFEPEATCQCVDYIHLVLEPSTTNRLIDRSTNRPTHQPTKKSIPASRAIKSLAQIRLNPFLLKVAPPLSNHFHVGDLRVASHALTFVDQLFLGVHPVGFKAHRCARTSLDVTHGAGGAARRAELGISERRPARRKTPFQHQHVHSAPRSTSVEHLLTHATTKCHETH